MKVLVKKLALLCLLLAVLGIACQKNYPGKSGGADGKKPDKGQEEKYKSIAKSKYPSRNKLEFVKNKSQTMVLCTSSSITSAEYPQQSVSYFVYDLKKDKIIFEGDIYHGSVSWESDHELRITNTPGMVPAGYEPGDNTQIYDLNTGKYRPLNPRGSDH